MWFITLLIGLLVGFISAIVLEIKFSFTDYIKDFFFAVQGFFIMAADFIIGIVKKIFNK